MNIKNSSNKIIGNIEITDTQIIINNQNKPLLIIKDPDIIEKVKNKDESIIDILFNEYYLLISEIAAMYEVCYATMARHLKKKGVDTASKAERRNSSYGVKFSQERIDNICKALEGKRKGGRYDRTSEIREKISNGLKQYYATHEVSEITREKLSDAWKRGCYNNAPMGRGHNGYFYSIKNNKEFYFRSLLELDYLLKLEQDSSIDSYIVEPFQIKLSNNHHYTPDILINNDTLIELKPKIHLNWEDEERWNMELEGANDYCKKHNYNFQIIYDEDIGFDSRSFKRWLLSNQNIIEQYNIRFIKELIWS